jgi:2'-5' RNA ligase
LFVAVYPPPEALDHLAAAVGELRLGVTAAAGTNVRLVARPLWHVTVAFLGEVAERRAAAAETALRAAVADFEARAARVPALRLAGGGRFGRHRFTLVWVGLAGDVDVLRTLGQAVRRELRRGRVPYDPKPLHPHLTIARPGDRLPEEDLAVDLAALDRYQGPDWAADAAHLVRSYQGPRPVHERIATYPLGST